MTDPAKICPTCGYAMHLCKCRPVGLKLAAVAALCLLLTACAPKRYLTAEQDADMREKCEATGCLVLPLTPELMRALGMEPV